MLQLDIVTLFPEMFEGPHSSSIVGRAVDSGVVSIDIHQLRDFTHDKRKTVDDRPFGGGPGMVLLPEPLLAAVQHVTAVRGGTQPHTVLPSPQGTRLTHGKVEDLAGLQNLLIVCGHYEGVDQRFIDQAVDEEISIGDYVLTGGELPAMVIVDAVTRLQPGALGDEESAQYDSFAPGLDGLLQGPVYTRPADLSGNRVPDVLLSGDHARLAAWRKEQAVRRTQERRPEMLEGWPDLDS